MLSSSCFLIFICQAIINIFENSKYNEYDEYLKNDEWFSLPPLSMSLQCPLLLICRSSQCCSYVHGWRDIHWHIGTLSVATFSIVNSLEIIFPTFAGILTDMIFWRSCIGSPGCCEFICVIAMSCLEDIISQHYFPSFGFYILSVPFSQCFPNFDWGRCLR